MQRETIILLHLLLLSTISMDTSREGQTAFQYRPGWQSSADRSRWQETVASGGRGLIDAANSDVMVTVQVPMSWMRPQFTAPQASEWADVRERYLKTHQLVPQSAGLRTPPRQLRRSVTEPYPPRASTTEDRSRPGLFRLVSSTASFDDLPEAPGGSCEIFDRSFGSSHAGSSAGGGMFFERSSSASVDDFDALPAAPGFDQDDSHAGSSAGGGMFFERSSSASVSDFDALPAAPGFDQDDSDLGKIFFSRSSSPGSSRDDFGVDYSPHRKSGGTFFDRDLGAGAGADGFDDLPSADGQEYSFSSAFYGGGGSSAYGGGKQQRQQSPITFSRSPRGTKTMYVDTETYEDHVARMNSSPPPTSALMTKFDVLETLGAGSFGKVFKARHKLTNSHYAIKGILYAGETDLDKAKQEVLSMVKLESPHIVRYYDAWTEELTEETKGLFDGTIGDNGSASSFGMAGKGSVSEASSQDEEYTHLLLIQMEVCDLTLHDLIDDASWTKWYAVHRKDYDNEMAEHTSWDFLDQVVRPRSVKWVEYECHSSDGDTPLCQVGGVEYKCHSSDVARRPVKEVVFMQILMGVSELHARNFNHRDLKPANIFLKLDPHAPEGFVMKIGDLGLASLRLAPGENERPNYGTPTYSAPEILDKMAMFSGAAGRPVDYDRADIYSLGIIAVEIFNKFDSANERGRVLGKVRETEGSSLMPIHAFDVMLPMIQGMLKWDPEQRISDAQMKGVISTYREALSSVGLGALHSIAMGSGRESPTSPPVTVVVMESPTGGGSRRNFGGRRMSHDEKARHRRRNKAAQRQAMKKGGKK